MKNRGGFTIVETIITLSVSSALFVTVMLLFSGRQARVEFSQGLRDVEAQIRDIANDVRNGYIPSVSGGFNCSVVGDVSDIKAGPGSASSCIFAGKTIFIDSLSGQMITYSIAGKRDATSLTLAELKPTIISNESDVDTSEIYNIPAGIKQVSHDGVSVVNMNGYLIGMFFDIAGVGVASSKTTPVVLRAQKPSNDDYASRKTTIEGPLISSIIPSGTLKLCFMSSGSDQYGVITIGRSINSITTKVEIVQQLNSATGCAS